MSGQEGSVAGPYSEMLAELASRVQEAYEKLTAYVASRQEPPEPSTDGLAEVTAILAELSAKLRRWQRQGTAQEGLAASDATTKPEWPPYDDSVPPIEEVLRELARDIPPEDWEAIPADLTQHLDHYLYGTPKT